MKSIISPHWIKGGTGITNFQPTDLKFYEAAIAKHPELLLEVSNQPIDSTQPAKGFFSLHCYKARIDLSSFWDTFHSLEQTIAWRNSRRIR